MEPRIQSLLLDDFAAIDRTYHYPSDQLLPFPLGVQHSTHHANSTPAQQHAGQAGAGGAGGAHGVASSRPAPVEPSAPQTATTYAPKDGYAPAAAKDAHAGLRDQRTHHGDFGDILRSEQPHPQQHQTPSRPSKSAVPLAEVLNNEQHASTGFSGSVSDLLDHGGDNSNSGGSRKRRKVDGEGGSNVFTLPKPQFPPVKKGSRRPRIPPLLQGLHQPPPNAGLFPPITGERAPKEPVAAPVTPPKEVERVTTPKPAAAAEKVGAEKDEGRNGTDKSPSAAAKNPKVKRRKWTEQETTDLLKGVARFGIGSWKKVLSCPDYSFNGRNAVDLKDRFRTCCPDEYKTLKTPSSKGTQKSEDSTKAASAPVQGCSPDPASASLPQSGQSNTQLDEDAPQKNKRGPKVHRKDDKALASIGIAAPFSKKPRRARRLFSEREDAALLRGFEKYGPSWSTIMNDPELELTSRHYTDLRDRFRIHWPDKYEKAGFKVNPPKNKPDDTARASGDEDTTRSVGKESGTAKEDQVGAITTSGTVPTTTATTSLPTSTFSHRHKPPDLKALLTIDPFHDPFTTDDFSDLPWPGDCSPVILPREIFSYASSHSHAHAHPYSSTSGTSAGTGNVTAAASASASSAVPDPQPDSHINPLDTLKIPRPSYLGGSIGTNAGAGGQEKTNLPPVWLSAPLTAGLERVGMSSGVGGGGGSGTGHAGVRTSSGMAVTAGLSAVSLPGPADMLLGLEMGGDGRGEGGGQGSTAFLWDELPGIRGFDESGVGGGPGAGSTGAGGEKNG
ncbi:hypothetical protein K490DRAFT_54635 [Saccharata proteae CBS 121410]|uniref:Myb-like domain-containing protein n=1 Tax=Saccharata proteae CBS 121410 TaxID=1314787 RepID=A0A9P4LYS3_9PEZI|nr:hypothetical protein K490DRAFT_54635 [Saccharata proteae CBS 121410]